MVLPAMPVVTQAKGAYRFETVKESDCLNNRRKSYKTVQYKNYLAVTTEEEYYNEANEGVSKKAYNQKNRICRRAVRERSLHFTNVCRFYNQYIRFISLLSRKTTKNFSPKRVNSMSKVFYLGVKKEVATVKSMDSNSESTRPVATSSDTSILTPDEKNNRDSTDVT